MGRRNTVFLAAFLAAVVPTGCEDPYEVPAERDVATTERPRATPPEPPPDGELPGTVPEHLKEPEPRRFPTAGRTPGQTLARAAALYGNWTSTTAAAQFRRIAALSVGRRARSCASPPHSRAPIRSRRGRPPARASWRSTFKGADRTDGPSSSPASASRPRDSPTRGLSTASRSRQSSGAAGGG